VEKIEEEIKGRSCLIVDDSEWIRSSVKKALSERGIFEHFFEAEDGIRAFKILMDNKGSIDMVLCDVIMPHIDGLKFLRMRAGYEDLLRIPVIMLTAIEESGRKVKGLEIGAQDWVVKPFEEEELVARVKVHLRIKNLQDKLERANETLTELAITDPLTKLFNRRHFFELLDNEFERAKRYARVMAFVLFDIDHFKEVNDKWGHQVGDSVLMKFAEILKSTMRRHDIIGRYGGEEFAVILPETRIDGAYTVAERFRKTLSKTTIEVDELELNIKVSGGLSQYPYKDVNSPDDLVRTADNALLEAKRLGRNRVARWG
jgi:diguanylate cyclase (GGDEF)-like protein